jgi:hypothetical protein
LGIGPLQREYCIKLRRVKRQTDTEELALSYIKI